MTPTIIMLFSFGLLCLVAAVSIVVYTYNFNKRREKMQINPHGGSCCGMSHLFRMGYNTSTYPTAAQIDELIKSRKHGHLVEVVVVDSQLADPKLKAALKAHKFRLVSRFWNRNSGNMVNVLHKYPASKRNNLEGSPYNAD